MTDLPPTPLRQSRLRRAAATAVSVPAIAPATPRARRGRRPSGRDRGPRLARRVRGSHAAGDGRTARTPARDGAPPVPSPWTASAAPTRDGERFPARTGRRARQRGDVGRRPADALPAWRRDPGRGRPIVALVARSRTTFMSAGPDGTWQHLAVVDFGTRGLTSLAERPDPRDRGRGRPARRRARGDRRREVAAAGWIRRAHRRGNGSRAGG